MQKILVISAAVITVLMINSAMADDSNYCGFEKSKYLAGMYSPEKLNCFIEICETGIACDEKRHYLRRETASALKKMLADFKKDHPKIKIIIRSSFRSFYDQKYIWNSKFDGVTAVSGKNLKKEIKNPRDRALEILKYSSMPGTSRHHWGSDFDINSLNNNYYSNGEGLIIYEWLKKNAGMYGFCQPYTSGRDGGYSEEKWHWSYKPVSGIFLKDYNSLFESERRKLIKTSGFSGMDSSMHNVLEYVNVINGDCR